MAGLTIENVTKTFGDFEALKDVSIDVRDGEFLAVLGPSGCGKTTLLRLVAGFEKVTAGEIRIGDETVSSVSGSVPPERRRVGIVFQNYALWPHMNVAENVGYSLKVAKVDKATRDRRIKDALALVDLEGFGDRRPANLSGGQRQRAWRLRAVSLPLLRWCSLTSRWRTWTCICAPRWKMSSRPSTNAREPPSCTSRTINPKPWLSQIASPSWIVDGWRSLRHRASSIRSPPTRWSRHSFRRAFFFPRRS